MYPEQPTNYLIFATELINTFVILTILFLQCGLPVTYHHCIDEIIYHPLLHISG